MTDEEIWEDVGFFEEMELSQASRQCYWCGGWYLYCDCNLGYDEDKRDFQRYFELRELCHGIHSRSGHKKAS